MTDANTLHEWREIARIVRGFGVVLSKGLPDVKDIRVLGMVQIARDNLANAARVLEKAIALMEEGEK